MSRFVTLKASAISILQSLPSFAANPDWVTSNDYRVLDQGVNYALVVVPGEVGEDLADQLTDWRRYDLVLDLFVRWRDTDAATMTAFEALRDELIEGMEENPTVGNLSGVLESESRSEGGPAWITDRTAPTVPVWYAQTFVWSVDRQTPTLSGGDF